MGKVMGRTKQIRYLGGNREEQEKQTNNPIPHYWNISVGNLEGRRAARSRLNIKTQSARPVDGCLHAGNTMKRD